MLRYSGWTIEWVDTYKGLELSFSSRVGVTLGLVIYFDSSGEYDYHRVWVSRDYPYSFSVLARKRKISVFQNIMEEEYPLHVTFGDGVVIIDDEDTLIVEVDTKTGEPKALLRKKE